MEIQSEITSNSVCVEDADVIPFEIETARVGNVTVPASVVRRGWIKAYFRATARMRSLRQFSRYDLGPSKKNYVPPRFLTVEDPEQPLLKPRNRQGQNPMIRVSRAWYEQWLHRDWETAEAFWKSSDVEEQEPSRCIIRVLE